jgi:pimeloyl-ACP methyl ester carboxylesterase
MDDVAARTQGRVGANGIELAYETFGQAGDPAIVLVMGWATQMIAWPDEMCEALATGGHFVVRFDNRDSGASTHLEHVPPPPLGEVLTRRRRPPYTIGDMADDVAALLDGLGLASVHLVGASMGGFIAQTVALRHPGRVRSLTLMMTSTGSLRVGLARPRVYARLLRREVISGREAAVASAVETFRLIGSRGYPFDEAHVREVAGRSWDRGFDPAGSLRQLEATVTQPNRTAALHQITVPALVMHGLADPLVGPSGGLALARAIPGCRFIGYPGMGHDLPRPLWPEFVEQITALAARGDRDRQPGAVTG